MNRSAALIALLLAAACAAPAPPPAGPGGPEAARALVTRALERMGGEEALRDVTGVRYDFMTQWQGTSFDSGPERVSYELHTDLRDYAIPAWRNTRRFIRGGTPDGWRPVVDIVRGDVAIRDFGQGFAPLNIAYVDERDELFAYTPDRLLLAAADDPDLRIESDTLIDGLAHARLRTDAGPFEATLLLRRADALPVAVRFRAGAPNDFGLVPWGEMDVEVRYSTWTTTRSGISTPTQWDVLRVGRPYKRLTVIGVDFEAAIPGDSFAVTPELATAFRETASRPMHDLPLDSARVFEEDFATFGAFGSPAGAVRVGGSWLLLETGQAPLSLDRAVAWMEENAGGAPALALAGMVRPGNGGPPALAKRGIPLHVGPGALPFVEMVLRNHGYPPTDARLLAGDGWLSVGTDSVRVERLDLPNARGSLVAWVPAHRWVWAPDALTPLDQAVLRERIADRGWDAAWVGDLRGLRRPLE